MRIDPITDTITFVLGGTGDHASLGAGGVVMAALYDGLLVGSVAIAMTLAVRDPQQRTAAHVGRWLVRLLLGTMWFQGSLWKLPLPVSGGLQFWTSEMAKYSAFGWHEALVQNVMLPNLWLLGLPTLMVEVGLAASLMLGLGVRVSGIVAALWTVNLWIGLYRHPSEWPWTYVFIMMAGVLLSVGHAGRSLGLDALAPRWPLRGDWLGRLWKIAA